MSYQLDDILALVDAGGCTPNCLMAGVGYKTSSCACRCGERYHGQFRHLADRLASHDGAPVGMYFHSFTSHPCGHRLVKWQGLVRSRLPEGAYLVQLFEWINGGTSGNQMVRWAETSDWQFYDTADEMGFQYEHNLSRVTDVHIAECEMPAPLKQAIA